MNAVISMSKMTLTAEQWTIYSASQNLPAVLNDPTKGKQSNFFIRTWGDSFIERIDINKSPFLPDINYSHFETYLRKHGRRYKKHNRLSQTKLELYMKLHKSKIDFATNTNDLSTIPDIFLKPSLSLNDAGTFNTIFPCVSIEQISKTSQSARLLQEKLSYYLDFVEVQIAHQVSQKSSAFFHAMTSHDTIMDQMGRACTDAIQLRNQIQKVDNMLSKDRLNLLGLVRSHNNHVHLLDKLRLMGTVLQTQPTLQLLLSSSDYVAALELIASTQDVLSRELAGVTSLRHLPSQLKEMSRLIDKMLNSEFERYAASDLHRPLDSPQGVVEPERLISIVAGLLKQQNLQFLEIYKTEAVTASQAILKQLTIEQIADCETENDCSLTGSGDVNCVSTNLDTIQWIRLLVVSIEAVSKLLQRVKDVHDIIEHTAYISAGRIPKTELRIDDNEDFLTLEDFNRVEIKLKDLLTTVCDYYHDRIAKLIMDNHSDKLLTKNQVSDLFNIIDKFCDLSNSICGKQNTVLKVAFNTQANKYIHHFHSQRKKKLILLLEAERWKTAEIPAGFQTLIDQLISGNLTNISPSSPKQTNKNIYTTNSLQIETQKYTAVGAVIMLLRLISEYCTCAQDLTCQVTAVGRCLSELLKTFNGHTCQLVLGANALKTAGLKTITSTNLAVASRSLQLILYLVPYIRCHFEKLLLEEVPGLDIVERDIKQHVQELQAKILSIMDILLSDQLKDWSARPPVPSKPIRNISRHLVKLHEAVNTVLPPEQINEMYKVIHKSFKDHLREQLIKMCIINDGGPKHGAVTSELTFYLQTLKSLQVLGEEDVTEKSMDDIWIRKI